MTLSRLQRGEGGQAMIMSTVFFIVISTALLVGLSAMTAGSERFVASVLTAERGLYIAQELAETAAYDLMHGTEPAAPPSFSGYTVSRNLSELSDNEYRIVSSVSWGRSTRTVEMILFASSTDSHIESYREIREE